MCISKVLTDLCSRKQRIKTKNTFEQVPVPLKIYADFEFNLESIESYEGSYSKTYQYDIPCSCHYKLVCVDDEFTNKMVVFRGKNVAHELIKAILKENQYCKK